MADSTHKMLKSMAGEHLSPEMPESPIQDDFAVGDTVTTPTPTPTPPPTPTAMPNLRQLLYNKNNDPTCR